MELMKVVSYERNDPFTLTLYQTSNGYVFWGKLRSRHDLMLLVDNKYIFIPSNLF